MPLEGLGKILLVAGGVIAVIGLLLLLAQHIPFFGKLPGDIFIKKDNWSFYFPVVTFLLVSIILTVLINLVLFFLKK